MDPNAYEGSVEGLLTVILDHAAGSSQKKIASSSELAAIIVDGLKLFFQEAKKEINSDVVMVYDEEADRVLFAYGEKLTCH